jgi:hypothetical protein
MLCMQCTMKRAGDLDLGDAIVCFYVYRDQDVQTTLRPVDSGRLGAKVRRRHGRRTQEEINKEHKTTFFTSR